MPEPRVQRVAAYVVCVEDGRVLLTRLTPALGSRWTLPGGGLEHGEDPLDTAVREAAEETGLDVRVDDLLTVDSLHVVRDHTGAEIDHHAIRIIYSGTVVGGTLRDEVDGSSDAAAWVPVAAVSGLAQVSLVKIGLAAWRAAQRPLPGAGVVEGAG
ncbi:NUDIX domain-containing protein [Pseudonocardia dioxanivorans]|uniref:NUDIX domain-containing protein n=1 Tax=Pseudonocardia dioxanivorans TaxID=240495 RepID=UPI001F444BEC|nr:NUDIX domain-containing protein [Pseudonocardia dioxanivorans]